MRKTKKMTDAVPELADVPNSDLEAYIEECKTKNPRKMSFLAWFWLHPTAYKFIRIAAPGFMLFVAVFFQVILWTKDKHKSFLMVMLVILAIVAIVLLLRTIKIVKFQGDRTLFEVYLKE